MGRKSYYKTRDSNMYNKHFLTRYTVREGEVMAVWDKRGKQNIVVGPAHRWVFRSRVTFQDRHTADQNQYLAITDSNGGVEHVRGPVSMYLNPVKHLKIEVKGAVRVEAMEVLVVNTMNNSGVLNRRIISGPTIFFPQPSDTIEQFSWHWNTADNKCGLMRGARNLTHLQIIPENFYFNVSGVRTADNALINIKLMIFYQLIDVDKMLRQTDDPILDMKNSIRSDVIAFCSQNNFDTLLDKMNTFGELEIYKNLQTAVSNMGFSVQKVVYRGYSANDQLQKLHNEAMTTRSEHDTVIRWMEEGLEAKARELEMEIDQAKRSNANMLREANERMELALASANGEVQKLHMCGMSRVEKIEKDNQVEIAHLNQLHETGVDITEYLVAPLTRVDKVVKVIGEGENRTLSSSSSPSSPSPMHRGGSVVSVSVA